MEKIKTAFGMGSPEGGIYDILKSEHRQVKASLMEIINSGRVMKDVFSQTVTALDQHLKGEESLLYPRLDRVSETRMMAIKAYEEHHLSRLVITDINSNPEDEKWLVKVQVLYDILDRHIDMEENHMFPLARKVISETEAMQLGRDYRTQTGRPMPAPVEPAVKPTVSNSASDISSLIRVHPRTGAECSNLMTKAIFITTHSCEQS